MDKLKTVDIDSEGKFKYIQIMVQGENGRVKYLVRGYRWAAFHADIFEEVEMKELVPLRSKTGYQISWFCPGGGWILHEPSEKHILIYGHSQGYGRPDHSISYYLVKQAFSEYDNIEWLDEDH